MFKIKRIYSFMLETFLPMFLMTFFICLFIVLMQFLWSHVDQFVGKGLGIGIIAELFFYAGLGFVPMALPLAILLASLMTFGNLGESLELLAMKSSGISLMKIMQPLTIFVVIVSIGAFFFQDDILPKVNTKMYSLLFGIKHKSPELQIPEGIFYKEIDDYNIYVNEKDHKTGLLKDVTIYIFEGSNIEDATVTVADSARVAETADGKHLKLTLWSGEQVGTFQENSRATAAQKKKHPKYRRESFTEKIVYIPYENDLERTDESMIASSHKGKNLATLFASVDSLDARMDSINADYGEQLKTRTYFRSIPEKMRSDTAYFTAATGAMTAGQELKGINPDHIEGATRAHIYNLDSIYASLRPDQMERITRMAQDKAMDVIATFNARTEMQNAEFRNRQLHELEIHKQFVLSIGCIIFFFIGAPLGAIIRKGGMGVPIIVSVAFFIFYYIIDSTGNKLAKEGEWVPWAGAWLSSMVLAPIGIFLTWRAINDSTLFDWDTYIINMRKWTRRIRNWIRVNLLHKKPKPVNA